MRILVIAPHCDDEYLATCNMIHNSPMGYHVLVAVSHGGTSEELPHIQGDALADWRESETLEFMKTIGCPHAPRFLRLGYPGELTQLDLRSLRTMLVKLIEQNKYKRIIAPHQLDRHPDHTLCGSAALYAARLMKVELWQYANSIVAAKNIKAQYGKPNKCLPITNLGLKYDLAQIYKSQKHFLPKHVRDEWFNQERFWVTTKEEMMEGTDGKDQQ